MISTFDHIQRREEHWAIVDLDGKASHIWIVPMPAWAKETLDDWLQLVKSPILTGGSASKG